MIRRLLIIYLFLTIMSGYVCGSGLVAYYSFDNEDGIRNDDSGNGLDLIDYYSGSEVVYSVDGVENGAADFNGPANMGYRIFANSTYSPLPYSVEDGVSFSIALWVNPESASDLLVSSFHTDSGYALRIVNGEYVFYTYNTDAGLSSLSTGVDAVVGEWTHLAMTFEVTGNRDADYNYPGTMTVYANGQMADSKIATYRRVSNTLLLGRRSDKGFDGLIDELAIFSGVLNSREVYLLAGFSLAKDDTAIYYVSPVEQGDGSGMSPADSTSYLSPNLWGSVQNTLIAKDVEVRFLDGAYTNDLIIVDVGRDEHRLIITGSNLSGAVFESAKFAMEGVINTTMRNFHFTGSVPQYYSHYIHPSESGRLSEHILIEDCSWYDLDVQFGATGVHYGSHHVTYRNCFFNRIGPSGLEHMMYHAYDAHHIVVENCYFEDCTGDYVRFRDNTDYGVIRNCYFKSNAPEYNHFFICIPLFNTRNPGLEFFATNYMFNNNTFVFDPDGESFLSNGVGYGLRVAMAFWNFGFDPPGKKHLMSADEGQILENGTAEQRKQLLLENCGIDTGAVHVVGNTFINQNSIALFRSYPYFDGAYSEWEGDADISDLLNYTDPEMHHCDHDYIADLNNDCRVDLLDVDILMDNWLVDCTYPSNLVTPECSLFK